MRVLVTGSRSWTDHGAVWKVLREIAGQAAKFGDSEMVVVHGCARGVDSFADSWVRTQGHPLPVHAERHPANWAKFGNRAGYIRNRKMVDLGADVCCAFLMPCEKPNCRRPKPHDTHGASDCADMAEGADIRTWRFHAEVA